MTERDIIDPLVKWPGGKRSLAEKIRRVFDGAPSRYVEVFSGGLAVYLLRYSLGELSGVRVVLADAEARLMAFYRAVRDTPGQVADALDAYEWGAPWKDSYDDTRTRFNLWTPTADEVASPDHAALFLWINRACFNGLYRVNQSGGFNVPIASYVTLSRPSRRDILRFSEALAGVELLTVRADVLLATLGKGDQGYCDPPYLDMFDQYTPEGFSHHDHVRLALDVDAARQRGAFMVISNSNTPRTSALYRAFAWEVKPILVTRSIAAKASSRGKESELLAVARP